MSVPGTDPVDSFDQITGVSAVDPTGIAEPTDTVWAAHIPPTWSTPGGVHGGVLVATGLRAALAGIDRPDLTLRIAHAVFLDPPRNDLLFVVTALRQGRASAHVRVIGQDPDSGRHAVDLTVILTADRESPGFLDAVAPTVAHWSQATTAEGGDLRDAPMPMAQDLSSPPLLDHLDLRPVLGRLPWEDGWVPDQPARHARWNRYRQPPAFDSGIYDPLMLLPIADLPGTAIWARFGPDEPILFFLSLDLSISFLEPVTEEWVLSDARARRLGEGHAYVETDLWSADRLVATSTQTMLRRRIP